MTRDFKQYTWEHYAGSFLNLAIIAAQVLAEKSPALTDDWDVAAMFVVRQICNYNTKHICFASNQIRDWILHVSSDHIKCANVSIRIALLCILPHFVEIDEQTHDHAMESFISICISLNLEDLMDDNTKKDGYLYLKAIICSAVMFI